MMMKNLILASGSPRRKELLSLYTTDFTICVSDFDESGVTAPTPAQLVEKLARGKCLAVAKDHPGAVVLGCDTVVDVGGEVFGKPPRSGCRAVEDAKPDAPPVAPNSLDRWSSTTGVYRVSGGEEVFGKPHRGRSKLRGQVAHG